MTKANFGVEMCIRDSDTLIRSQVIWFETNGFVQKTEPGCTLTEMVEADALAETNQERA